MWSTRLTEVVLQLYSTTKHNQLQRSSRPKCSILISEAHLNRQQAGSAGDDH